MKNPKNYLFIDGKKIELTDEQIALIKGDNKKPSKLCEKRVGETFEIGKHNFIVLEHFEDGTTAVILKDLLFTDEVYGENNNYDGSNVDKLCVEFGRKIANIVGNENLVPHTVDLTADDGLKCYGSVTRQMSLITAEMCRRYVYVLDEHKINKWWWLATAYSTPKHGDSHWVKCVAPSGCIYGLNSNFSCNGVRPFCILKSNIFVS